jgi:hypothetical protein
MQNTIYNIQYTIYIHSTGISTTNYNRLYNRLYNRIIYNRIIYNRIIYTLYTTGPTSLWPAVEQWCESSARGHYVYVCVCMCVYVYVCVKGKHVRCYKKDNNIVLELGFRHLPARARSAGPCSHLSMYHNNIHNYTE